MPKAILPNGEHSVTKLIFLTRFDNLDTLLHPLTCTSEQGCPPQPTLKWAQNAWQDAHLSNYQFRCTGHYSSKIAPVPYHSAVVFGLFYFLHKPGSFSPCNPYIFEGRSHWSCWKSCTSNLHQGAQIAHFPANHSWKK